MVDDEIMVRLTIEASCGGDFIVPGKYLGLNKNCSLSFLCHIESVNHRSRYGTNESEVLFRSILSPDNIPGCIPGRNCNG